jgi:hypothetical protein
MGSTSPFLAVVVGAVALAIPDLIAFGLSSTHLIPLYLAFKVFGVLIRVFAYLAGLGALVLGRFGSRPITIPGSAAPGEAGSQPAVTA